MADYTMYHNPRCSKSRQTLALLEEKGIQPELRLYLESPPSAAELVEVLGKLSLSPRQLLRKGEAAYAEAGLDEQALSDAEVIAAMVAEPILMERPIVVKGGRAVLGRPPENVLDLIGS
jgi:arsenate reductase